MWRGEVRLLFRAYHPKDGSRNESLVLVKYFEGFLGSDAARSAFPPSVLTHVYRRETPAPAGGAGGAAEGPGGSDSRIGVPATPLVVTERVDAAGRYTGAIRVRFAPASRPFAHRYAVMPLSSLVRAEHVLPDIARTGLDAVSEAFYVNPWKWAQESVGDDAGKGEQFQMAPL